MPNKPIPNDCLVGLSLKKILVKDDAPRAFIKARQRGSCWAGAAILQGLARMSRMDVLLLQLPEIGAVGVHFRYCEVPRSEFLPLLVTKFTPIMEFTEYMLLVLFTGGCEQTS